MANKKITELDAATSLASTDVVPVVDVSEDVTKKITATNLFRTLPDGTAAAPSLSFASDAGNGVFLAGTDTVGISTGGTQRVTVDGSGNVSISGDLTVSGATTTVESTTVTIDDKNIELGSVASPSNTTADGGGITLKGATDKTLKWINSTGCWTFNQPMNFNDHVRIDSSGRVGINNTNPSTQSSAARNLVIGTPGSGSNSGISICSSTTGAGNLYFADATSGGATGQGRLKYDFNTDSMQLYTATAERLRINSSGNVGLGTSSPSEKLHVSGTDETILVTPVANATNQDAPYLIGGTTAYTGANTNIATHGFQHRIKSTSGGVFRTTVDSHNGELFCIEAGGDVGIGTSTPAANLHITGSGDTIARVTSADGSGAFLDLGDASDPDGGRIVYDSGSNLAFYTASSERLRIDSSGRLLLNTTTAGDANADGLTIHRNSNTGITIRTGDSNNGNIFFDDSSGVARGSIEYNHSSDLFKFNTAGTGRLYIDSSGNVGIGTSSPGSYSSAANNLVVQDTAGEGGITIVSTTTGASNIFFADTAGSTQGQIKYQHSGDYMRFYTNAAERLRIDSSGRVGIGTTSPSAPLDVRGTGLISRFESSSSAAVLRIANTETNDCNFTYTSDLAISVGGSERTRIDSSGRLLVGVSSTVSVAGSSSFIQHHGNKTTSNLALVGYNNNLGGPILSFGGSRSTTVGTPGTIVSSGDHLGDIRFAGDDGTDINSVAASIRGEVDGTPGSNDMPGRLVFSTTADGASSATERMRIDSNGVLISSHATINGGVIGTNGNELRLQSDINANGTPFTSFYTGSSERMRIDNSGRVLVGTSSARSLGRLEVEGTTFENSGAVFCRNANSSGATAINLCKSRGTSAGSTTIVQSGDVLGSINFRGADGSNLRDAAKIQAEVDGTPGTDDMPGRLVFSTKADGASSLTERLRITSTGAWAIEGASNYGTSGQVLTSNGNDAPTWQSPSAGAQIIAGNTNVECVDTGSNGHILFDTEGTERMRIDSSGKVGIGTASPSSKLHIAASTPIFNIESSASSGDGAQIRFTQNFNRVGRLYMTSEAGTSSGAMHLESPEVRDIVFKGETNERCRINRYGKVLIGTTIEGAADADNLTVADSGHAGITIRSGTTSEGAIYFSDATSGNGEYRGYLLYDHDGDLLRIGTSAGERMRINSSGNVLIGDTSDSIYNDTSGGGINLKANGQLVLAKQATSSADPLVWLNDTGQTTNKSIVFAQDGSEKANIGLAGNDATVTVNGTERVRIDSSGRVGIGSNAPGHNLEVKGSFPDIAIVDSDTTNDKFRILHNGGSTQLQVDPNNVSSGSHLLVAVDGTERMRITSGGLVYAGTTTADGSAHIFATSAPSSFAFKIHNTNSNNSVPTRGLQVKYDVSPNDTNSAIQLNVGNGVPFVVRNNGNVQNTNGSFTSFSDARYKENIVDASSQWEDIKNTRIRNWNFRPELGWATHTMIGPVAQELELVSPGLVDDNPVIDEDGNDTGEVQKSVNQSVLYMKAVKALQEAMDRIEQLEAKVAALEAS